MQYACRGRSSQDVDGRPAQKPYGEGGQSDDDVEQRVHSFGQCDDWHDDKCHDGRPHPLKRRVDHRIMADVGEQNRNQQDDDERWHDDPENRGHSAGISAHLVAHEDRSVERDGPGGRLGERQQIEKFAFGDPAAAIDHLAPDERNHRIAAPESEQSDFQKTPEKRE